MIFNNNFKFEKNIKEVKSFLDLEYKKYSELFFMFLLKNNITIGMLKNLKKETNSFLDFKIIKKENSILLEKDNYIIEVSYAPKNSFKITEINKENYHKESLKEGSIINIIIMFENKIFNLISNEKELFFKNKKYNYIYSPNKKNWNYKEFLSEKEFVIILESPVKQIHRVKIKENNIGLQKTYLSDTEILPEEIIYLK